MRRIVVLKPDQFLSPRRLLLAAAVAGVLVALAILLMLALGPEWLAGLALIALGVIWPLEITRRIAARLRRAWHAGQIGIAFAVGLALPRWLALLATFSGLGSAMAVFGTALFCMVFGTLAAGVWWSVHRFHVEVFEQDGTLCPGCAYCLTGNTSMKCPECGRAYTLDELRVSDGSEGQRAEGDAA